MTSKLQMDNSSFHRWPVLLLVSSLEKSKPELMYWSYTRAGLAQEHFWDSWDVISGLVS